MNFGEAIKVLRDGERIARIKWNRKMFIEKKDNKVDSYHEAISTYCWHSDMFLSDDWIIDNDDNLLVPFHKAIDALKAGKKVKLPHWKDMNLEYNPEMREVILRHYMECGFTPTFDDICANDWERF